MQINVIKIIQDALIGGTNGHMAFMYNNHFIRGMFDSFHYEHKEEEYGLNYEDAKFKAFLKEVLQNEEQK